MKSILVIIFVLLLTGPLGAETYSWVDETGTYNFSEDLSRVPKKYRKNVNRRGDMGSREAAPAKANPEKSTQADPRKVEDSSGKSGGSTGADTQLFGGKTQDAWRNELKAHELELTTLEQQLERIKKQITTPARLSRERQTELVKEFENTRENYNQKYKAYGELVESARKAGLVIEIKK